MHSKEKNTKAKSQNKKKFKNVILAKLLQLSLDFSTV